MAKQGKQEMTPRTQEVQRMPRMMAPLEEMERMFENFFPTGWARPFRAPFFMEGEAKMPAIDIIDRDADVVLRAEMPGVEKDNIDISMSDNTVTIRGSSAHEEKESGENYHRCEIARGAFSRTVTLPADVDSENTKASLKDGVLELVMPKIERSKRHSIKVQ